MHISQLPSEILYRIFQVVQSEPADKDAAKPPQKRLEWIKVTHVCQLWREVAIDSASLWALPPLHNAPWAIEMLNRSKTSPVRILLDATTVASQSVVLSTVIAHMNHVSVFDIWNARPAYLLEVFRRLPESMPVLEELAINVHSITSREDDNSPPMDIGDPIGLPDSIWRRAPNLRRLCLHKVDINWEAPMLSSLTTLKVFLSSRPAIEVFRSALGRMPNLEVLTIQNAVPLPAPAGTPRQEPIVLTRVKTLSVGGEPDGVGCFFNNFTAPAAEDVHSGLIYDGEPYDLPFIFSTIKHPYSRPAPGPRYLQFIFHRLFLAQFVLSGPPEAELPSLNIKVVAMHDIALDPDIRAYDNIVKQLFSAFDWSRLEGMDISGASVNVSEATLASTFGSVRTLQRITVGPRTAPVLLSVFNRRPGAFPALREVTFYDVHFDNLLSMFSSVPVVNVHDVVKCFNTRERNGREIWKLTVKKCHHFDPSYVDTLEGYAWDVEWDGVTRDGGEEHMAMLRALADDGDDDDGDGEEEESSDEDDYGDDDSEDTEEYDEEEEEE